MAKSNKQIRGEHAARLERVQSGETSAMEEIASILGVHMTPAQRAQELRAQQARVAAKRSSKKDS